MKCVIEIDGRPIPLDWRGGTAIQYKYVFKTDPLADMMSLIGLVDPDTQEVSAEKLMAFDTEIIYRMFWTAARVADNTVNEDFYEFLDEFDRLPVVDIIQGGLLEMLITNMVSTKESKNFRAPAKTNK